MKYISFYLTLVFLALSLRSASAHIGYSNRNLGTYSITDGLVSVTNNNGTLTANGGSGTVLITNQNVATNFGWAAGTDARFGDSHDLRAFRFTLTSSAIVTISIQGLMYSAGSISFDALAHPAFSLFAGLAHMAPNALDHDSSAISTAWLNSLVGAGNYDGAFNALGDWKIGSDDGTTFADLSSFTYIGNAADGSSVNYGSAVGINGDGVADGVVTATFNLNPGDYTIFVGGGDVGGTSTSSYGLQASLTVVPEPHTWTLLVIGLAFGLLRLRRRSLVA